MVTLQFQYMKAPPFDTVEARKRCTTRLPPYRELGVEERLQGRTSFPMSILAAGDNLERFIEILDDAVDQIVRTHKGSRGPE